MSLSELNNRWRLNKASLECRKEILEDIILDIRNGGYICISDTANSSDGKYILQLDDNLKSGIININCKWWTQRGRVWDSDKEQKEADNADEFIHTLIQQPIHFELTDNKLILNKNYQFVPYE